MNVYVDNAATTKVSKRALGAMLPALEEQYGNPSSPHHIGQEAAKLLTEARETIAALIGAKPSEITFTSGGTEADNQAILTAAALGAKKGKRHIITTKFEHHAVLHPIKKLENQGFEITYLDVNGDGVVRLEDVATAIRPDTALVTIMYANNEIGTIQPIANIGKLCREKGILFHTDAVQAVGHLPVNVQEDSVDLLSFSAHKFHGPKGVGVLYARQGVPLTILIEGGAQERNKRGGTENLPAILGMAAALKEACKNLEENTKKLTTLRDKLIDGALQIEEVILNGSRKRRLPGNVNISVKGIEGESLLLMLDMAGIAASSGSACTSGSLEPSHVLLALGLTHEIAHGSLRMSLSEYNTEEEVDYILEKLPPIVARLRAMSPLWNKIKEGN